MTEDKLDDTFEDIIEEMVAVLCAMKRSKWSETSSSYKSNNMRN